MGMFGHKKRDSFNSPLYLGRQKLELKKPIKYTIKSSLSAAECWENNPDKGSDSSPKYNEQKNVVTKFAFATRVGHMPNNPYKLNQDAFILAPNILNLQSMHYFGVCDGHGVYGKDVSNIIKQQLPAMIEQHLYNSNLNIKNSLSQSFLDCNSLLINNSKFDINLSGSTCWTALFYGDHLYAANSGDSRAIVVGKGADESELVVRALTRDHKPGDEDEKI